MAAGDVRQPDDVVPHGLREALGEASRCDASFRELLVDDPVLQDAQVAEEPHVDLLDPGGGPDGEDVGRLSRLESLPDLAKLGVILMLSPEFVLTLALEVEEAGGVAGGHRAVVLTPARGNLTPPPPAASASFSAAAAAPAATSSAAATRGW